MMTPHSRASFFFTNQIQSTRTYHQYSKIRSRLSIAHITEYKKQNCKLSTEAIEAFQISEKKLGFGAVKFKAPNLHNTKLKIGGITLSVFD